MGINPYPSQLVLRKARHIPVIISMPLPRNKRLLPFEEKTHQTCRGGCNIDSPHRRLRTGPHPRFRLRTAHDVGAERNERRQRRCRAAPRARTVWGWEDPHRVATVPGAAPVPSAVTEEGDLANAGLEGESGKRSETESI